MHLGVLNPEAGNHAMAADPAELAAGAVADARSFEEFPYYAIRFGERGRRFGSSDTAWLITLCDRTAESALQQAAWLGVVLSSRGMPQYLLECHLRNLHAALVDAMPERKPRYAVLASASRRFAKTRRSQFTDADFQRLAASFEPFPRFGHVLVSAVADEALGIENAVPSLQTWLATTEWNDAALAVIAAARARLQSAGP
jgi:hypothetical protein